MQIRRILALIVSLLVVGGLAAPAGGVTNGTLDGDDHPYVGLSLIYGPPLEGEELQELKDALGIGPEDPFDERFSNPAGRCTGTLVSDVHFLTAGHCVTVGPNHEDGTPNEGFISVVWFHSDVDAVLEETGYPFQPQLSDPLVAAGQPEAHPEYNDDVFYLHDLGVIVLEENMGSLGVAQLPTLGVVDELAAGPKKRSFSVTAVGYGLQAATPNPLPKQIERKEQADRVRYQAELAVKDTKGTAGVPAGTSFSTSGNKGTGTCFGDSGGPNFVGDSTVIAGVTSFGQNLACGGVGGVYRVDTADDLDWLQSEFGLSP